MPQLDLNSLTDEQKTYEGTGENRRLVSATDGTTTLTYDAEGNVTSATITLTADTADGYFTLLALRDRLALAQDWPPAPPEPAQSQA